MEPREHRMWGRVRAMLVRGGWLVCLALTTLSVATAQATRPAARRDWEQITTLLSVPYEGDQADDQSEFWANQSISADGRYVVFLSYATNLVPGDTNRLPDIFVRDRLSGLTTRVNLTQDGKQANDYSGTSCISGDGRFVAFHSYATNLVQGDTNRSIDVFCHDRLTAETTRVSVDSSGVQGNDSSFRPSISADGRYVAFKSLATNLVTGDTNDVIDIFVHDRSTGETTRVSVDSAGNEADGRCGGYSPSISADGRCVAFSSEATNLVPDDRNGYEDVFVHDRSTGETTRVSVDSAGNEAIGASWYPSISGDGRYVAFMGSATNLVLGDTNYEFDIFVHDRSTGETTRVSVTSGGQEGDIASFNPAISGDGNLVAFHSYARNLAPGCLAASDIFVHNRSTRVTRCMSVRYKDIFTIIRGFNQFPSISADGRYVAFEGADGGLVPGDTNDEFDVFARGPELTLEADPGVVAPGQVLTLTEYKSVPGNPASLWVVSVNGSRTLMLVAAGNLGGDGNFVVSGIVPPGLSGESITFRGYVLGHAGVQVRCVGKGHMSGHHAAC
ncbi:MAG: calcium-binding protein [Planctomycetota bacterium]